MKKVEEVVRMVGGTGSNSYAANSQFHGKAIIGINFVVKEALAQVVGTVLPESLIVVADLGCSSSPNTFILFSDIMDVIAQMYEKLGKKSPEIQLILNDLPGNDFNTLLGPLLSSHKEKMRDTKGERFLPFYTTAVPGSFYERLFPRESIHFIHSSFSVHWLSQVPQGLTCETSGTINKGNIYISETSPPLVLKLYQQQFQRDFNLFLKHRSKEMYSQGQMVLIFVGRKDSTPSNEDFPFITWVTEALNGMVIKGRVKASDMDTFNLPVYFASMEEVKSVIQNEESFELVQNHMFEWSYNDYLELCDDDATLGEMIEKNTRATIEPVVTSHFGESILNELFSNMSKIGAKRVKEEECKLVYFAISLRKKG